MSALVLETSGDSALLRWRGTRTTATMTRRRTPLIDLVASPPTAGLVVLFGDPTTDPDCDITTVTVNVCPSTATLAVASVALMLEEMLVYSAQDPVMCALVIVGSHNEAVWYYVSRVARRRATHLYSLRAPVLTYSVSDIETTLAQTSEEIQREFSVDFKITWDIAADCNV
jgi:hypothetical protein